MAPDPSRQNNFQMGKSRKSNVGMKSGQAFSLPFLRQITLGHSNDSSRAAQIVLLPLRSRALHSETDCGTQIVNGPLVGKHPLNCTCGKVNHRAASQRVTSVNLASPFVFCCVPALSFAEQEDLAEQSSTAVCIPLLFRKLQQRFSQFTFHALGRSLKLCVVDGVVIDLLKSVVLQICIMLSDKVDLHGQKTWPSRWPCLNWLLSGPGSLSSHAKHPLSSCLLDVCFCLMPMYPGQAYFFGCSSSSTKTCIQIVAKHICIKLRGLQDTTKSKLSVFTFSAEPRFTHKNNLGYLGLLCS